jgi:hypothetical protein
MKISINLWTPEMRSLFVIPPIRVTVGKLIQESAFEIQYYDYKVVSR